MFTSVAGLLFLSGSALGQAIPAQEQLTSWNSTFSLSPDQITAAKLSEVQVDSINAVVRWDRSQLANGGPYEDSFYNLPPLYNTTQLRPGQVLKVQEFTDPTNYTLAANTALSRILYTTTTFNGTVIPASAYILWPYTPKSFSGDEALKSPPVLWNHGNTGVLPTAAPSAMRALAYGQAFPLELAVEGYAVIAPDYAGLGVGRDFKGNFIPHQFGFTPASAHDALYALRAAREAFPDLLLDEFVNTGHSQGGGVAWAVAEVLAAEEEFADLIAGYLGTISFSPLVNTSASSNGLLAAFFATSIGSVFPEWSPELIFNPLGLARFELFTQLEGVAGILTQLLLTGEDLFVEDWQNSWFLDRLSQLGDPGSKPFAGPMLVLHGDIDPILSVNVTSDSVEETCELYPDSDLEYVTYAGVGHSPILDGARQTWKTWLEDRFAGKPLKQTGCKVGKTSSWLPNERYTATGNGYLQWVNAPEYTHAMPLGI